MINLEKRIKRHMTGSRHDFFAAALPGCEALCRRELAGLSETVQVGDTVKGGVAFSGRLTDLYLANLHLRTAGRILMRIAAFKATNFSRLAQHGASIAWSLFLPAGALPDLNVTARRSRLYHTQAVAERLRGSIASHWTCLGISPEPAGDQTLYVRLVDDMVTISLDSSGDNLYRRGLKTHAAQAPLRETQAAAILQLAGYSPDRPLVDPMCGAGTFSLEAALTAKAMAPGALRSFAFMRWPCFRPQQWGHLKNIAGQQVKSLDRPCIHASDHDGAACDMLLSCARQNGLDDAMTVCRKDFFDLRPDQFGQTGGLVVLNPPYGRRIVGQRPTAALYQRIAAKLQKDFKGWKAALLVPDKQLARALKLPLKSFPMPHGGLELILLAGRL